MNIETFAWEMREGASQFCFFIATQDVFDYG
ncbi:Uncharacterised protein [Yersinia massiliensis]|nr:Uncharacterised protein [Yersinia massiliensis]